MPRALTFPAVRATAKALDILMCDAPQGGFTLRLRYPGSPCHYAPDLTLALDVVLALAELDATAGEGA